MNERIIMISEYLSGDYTISQLAQRRGISRKTIYKWIARYEEDQNLGLMDRSRAPLHHPNATAKELEELILRWKAKRPLWGAPKIHSKLVGLEGCPAESTVSNILRRHGLCRRLARRSRPAANAGPMGSLLGANQLWCADFKGWFRTGDGQRCDPLTISDAYSRYLLCCQGMVGFTGFSSVQPIFESVFREYGLPQAIRTDNGAPFASNGLVRLSPLSVWWLKLGIRLELIEPGHPEQNGRHERMHRTLKEGVLNPPAANLAAQQKGFDEFRQEYNQERPHEALNQNPPASVYEPSKRSYPKTLLEPQYPDGWQKRSVRTSGEIKWKGQMIYVSQTLTGQQIGIEPAGDGVWKLHFMDYPLGQLDERKKRVIPLRRHPKENESSL